MVLTSSMYWMDLELCIHIEACRDKYNALLKSIYDAYPEDLLIAKFYAKGLLQIHGTIQFSLMTEEMMEDSESKRDLDEAQKVVEKLEATHGYTKL